jgi:hypothetical protein
MSVDVVRRADFYYVGAFDDEIQRYNKTALDLTTINEILSQAALYGGRLLINDGYLMLYPAGRLALVNRAASPLLDLIDARYVRLYSRNDGHLAEMPLQMQHIKTYEDLVKSPEWVHLKRNLEDLEIHIKEKGAFEGWPKVNVGPGFQRLVNVAFDTLDRRSFEGHLTPKQADRILEEFNSVLNSAPTLGARQVWTQTYERPDFGISETGKSFLHWLGIEAYHYNLAMTACLNDRDSRPGVITRYSCFFNNLCEPPLSSASGGAGYSEMPRPSLPRGIPREALYGGKFLKEVVTFGTELERRKYAYLESVQKALSDRNAIPETKKAADDYSAAIRSFLEPHDTIDQTLDSIRTPLEIVIGGALAGGAWLGGMGAGAAIVGGLLAWVGSHFLISGTGRRLDTHVPLAIDLMEELEDYKEVVPTLSEPLQGTQWFASLMVRADAAGEHVKTLPPLLNS